MDLLHRFLSRFGLLAMLLITAIVVPMKLFDPSGLPRIQKLTKDLRDIERANNELAEENRALREEIRLFHSEPDYLEKVARDQLGMVGTSDLVYQFAGSASP
ncbi:MAG: septum formation initiator family protein [Myxococcota bacterium]|jgi:cell division protein FtsB|nr:septum formation initiator family protein [Myxococcota bacterium]